jgi:aminoglycoside phosphotransferase (APT) family kinase protein
VLIRPGELRAKLSAAHAVLLRRFDAADGHDADGYATSAAWLAAKAKLTKNHAKAAMARMRQLSARPQLADALAAGDLCESWVAEIAKWTEKLPAQLRDATDKVLVEAAAGGACLDDLAAIVAALSQLRAADGGSAIERAWLNARTGDPGYLTGAAAQAAACDALTVPVVAEDRHDDIARIRRFLTSARPDSEATALIHGDFKFNNVIVGVGQRIAGVVDWELAAIGDPLLDVAHMWAATWATAPAEYGGIRGVNLAEAGLPTIEEYEAEYVAAGGRPGALTTFYKALALLRYGGIFRGVGQRVAAGAATSAGAADQEAFADIYVDLALRVIDAA